MTDFVRLVRANVSAHIPPAALLLLRSVSYVVFTSCRCLACILRVSHVSHVFFACVAGCRHVGLALSMAFPGKWDRYAAAVHSAAEPCQAGFRPVLRRKLGAHILVTRDPSSDYSGGRGVGALMGISS